jgi:hypothetical protein
VSATRYHRGMRCTIAVIAALAVLLTGCAPPPEPSGQVVAVLEFAGVDPDDETQVTASGYVDGVSESNGRCFFTFYAEGGSASRLTAEGVADGTRTLCGPVSESVGLLVDDRYEVELKYESDAVETVRSERVEMELPGER